MITKAHLFYGWWIVVAGFLIVAYGTGADEYMSSQLPDLLKEFGGSAITLGAAISIHRLSGSIALLAIGPLIDRFGPRKLMLIGIPLAGIGFLCLSFVNNVLTLDIVLGALLGLGISAGFLLPVQTATANWFIRRRSAALAIVCVAAVLGEAITSILGERITDGFDWRGMFLGLGVVMLAICIPLAFIIRHRPEQSGYLPDGELSVKEETSGPGNEQGNHIAEINFTLWQAMRSRTFWMLAIATALVSGTGVMATAYRMFFLIDRGFTQADIAEIFRIAPLMGLAGVLLFGYLGDVFPKRYLLAVAIALKSASVVILMTTGSIVQVYIYTLVYGLGSGMVPLILAIRADYFGRRAFATITVAMMFISGLISSPLSMPWPFLAGWIIDVTGSFQLVFVLSMLIGFIPAVVFFYARPPKPPQSVLPLTES